MRRALTPCRQCRALTRNANGLCDEHKHVGWQQVQALRDPDAYGAAWRDLRDQVLTRDGYICVTCKAAGHITAAKAVDHIIPRAHGGSDALSNLQALCAKHHATKTARERLRGGAGGV